MSDIDDDIWESAKDMFQRHCPFSEGMTLEYAGSMAKHAIAAAIQAERERCATIAYVEAVKHCSARDGMTLIGHPVGYSIAAAIRTPASPNGE